MKFVFVMALFLPCASFAADGFIGTGRVFAGVAQTKPEDLNLEMKAQSLKEFSGVLQYGAEGTYPLFGLIDIGARYVKKSQTVLENPSNLLTDYEATLSQDAVSGVLRIPFIKSNFVRADVFGSVGTANTFFKIKTAGQDGELKRTQSLVSSYGGSLALGYKSFYVVFEAGIESNKVGKFERSGNINTNVDEIDLSGSYVLVGLMFYGTKMTSKK